MKTGDLVRIRMSGGYVMSVDPQTRKSTDRPQVFRLLVDGPGDAGLTPVDGEAEYDIEVGAMVRLRTHDIEVGGVK